MRAVANQGSSLALHLESLISSSENARILKSFILPATRDSSHDSEIITLDTKARIRPENAEVGASHLASAMWPAIRKHAEHFHGKSVSVLVADSPGALASHAEVELARSLKIDVTALEHRVRQGMEAAGVNVDRITLYNIRLGTSSYYMVTVYGDRDPKDWNIFRSIRGEIKEDFGANIHLTHSASTKKLPLRSDESFISPQEFLSQREYYLATVRPSQIPTHLKNVIEDWRDVHFLSIDDGKTRRPEDLMNAKVLADGSIDLKVAIPIIGAASPYFKPFEDLYCIGLNAIINESGALHAFNVRPVIAHNSTPLDFNIINHLVQNQSTPSNVIRLKSIARDEKVLNQIQTLFILAHRILSHQIASGSAVSFELSGEKTASTSVPQLLKSEVVTRVIQTHVHQLLAQWTVSATPQTPIVLLKPQFKDDQLIREMKKVLPWVEHHDVYHPAQREKIAYQLRGHEREDLIARFAESLRESFRQRRLKVITHPKDLLPEDICRFKHMRSIVGNINNLQLISTLLDFNPLPRSVLVQTAQSMSKRGAQGAVPAQTELVIRSAVRDVREYLTSQNLRQ